ncbi:DNA adenine methylase [Pseudomonas aeruginosa]|uniref:DNA adenine methylase n=1 Tax=Pseudomonas aeruginosa TaxID=287 RepID=UPI000F81CA2C|nr:DNA adenine methylase [Pseudomonas aeruginosa]RTV75098.1 DNA adenine methylase [Pseudomonas aeruginosa]
MADRFFTPLRYPGGKSKLCGFIRDLIRVNNFEDGVYVEPYAGGAGVALELLLTDVVSKIHINDLNVGVFNFWSNVLLHTEQFIEKIYSCSLNMEEWYVQRGIFNSPSDHSGFDIGFAFFYLNRTNRSGIINGGVIGGYDQTGNYKIDARFNKDALVERIIRIARRSDDIFLYNMDAELFLQTIDVMPLRNALIYIDPPYYVNGRRLYDNFYEHDDHGRISKLVASLKTPWVLSYDDTEQIRRFYSNSRVAEIDLIYSAQRKMKGQEVIFFSENLTVPTSLQVA